MVEPDRSDFDGTSGSWRRGRLAVVGAVGVAGLLIGWVFGITSNTSTTSTSTTGEGLIVAAPTSTTTSAPSTPGSVTRTTELAPVRGRVELLPGSLDLRGSIALAVPGPIGDQNLWLIEPGGRMIQRVEAHIRPSGYRYPMMIVGDHVLTTTSTGTFRMGIDLAQPAQRIEEPGFLIPDAKVNRAWLVGGGLPEWFALFNGDTGEIEERTDVPSGFGWPFTGYDDGVLFQPQDTSASGGIVLWPRRGEPSALDVELDPQSAIHSVMGDLGVVVSPGSSLATVDLRTGERTADLVFDSEGGNVVGVCLSEDGVYLAAISSTGVVEVFETATGDSRGRITTADPPFSVGWTAPNQLVSIGAIEGASPLSLQLFNVAAGLVSPIARLEASGIWRMATSSRPC